MAKKPAEQQLKDWMEGRYTQVELAAMLKVRQQTVSMWLAGGRAPALHHARELERLTGIVAWDWIQPGGEK